MTKPEDLFRAEKERAVTARNSQHARLLAEAKAAFDKLMAEGQAARKSGRPRKHPLPPLKTSSSRTPPPARPAADVRLAAPVPVTTAVKAESKPAPKPAAKPADKGVAKPAARRAASKSGVSAKRQTSSKAHGASSARAKKAPKPKAKSAKRR